MAPSAITKTCKKAARELTKPIRTACRRVRTSIKAIGRPSYEYEQAKSAMGTTRVYQGPLVHRTLEETEESAMYSRTQGQRIQPERPETSSRPATGSAGSAGSASAAKETAASNSSNKDTDSASGDSWSSFAYLGNIHRMDDISELVPPAGPKKNVQQWLSSSSSSGTRSIYSGSSGSPSRRAPPRKPRLAIEAASWEQVQLASSEATEQAQLMLQDPRYLTSARFVSDEDQWGSKRRRTTWEQRQRRYSSASSSASSSA